MPSDIILAPAIAWSGALRRKLTGTPDFEPWLLQASQDPVTRQTIQTWHNELRGQTVPDLEPAPIASAVTPAGPLSVLLRQLRERVFFTLMVRDIAGVASLFEVVVAMSALADLAVGQAYRSIARDMAQRHGIPRDPQTGLPQEMLIVGMGKLGGRELNVSSDIDLVMLYAHDGTTDGEHALSHSEFYGRVVQRMVPILSDHDAYGYVFRCDLRLRPDGGSGALAWSLAAFEKYLITQGREWERYAWVKARILPAKAFPDSQPDAHSERLESLRLPFVYRKYFDFDALSALRHLRERVRQDWERRALARTGVDKTHNIKLGDGGIREIEFVVQLNQLIRGGRTPSLQQQGLHAALYKQNKAGVLPDDVVQALTSAYFFLRRLEHVLQYREDEQTHLLPRNPEQRAGLAHAMGLEPKAFEQTLASHRKYVSTAFRKAFRLAGVSETEEDDTSAPTLTATTSVTQHVHTHLGSDAHDILQHIERLLNSHRFKTLPTYSRQRLDVLLPELIRVSTHFPDPVTTARRLLGLIEHIISRSAYLALLVEYPDTLIRVARIVSASPWAAQYLTQYPLLLDSLIQWNALMAVPDLNELANQLRAELDACLLPDGQPDVEQQMNLMRDLQHQVTFQLLAQDLAGALTVEHLADQLSALADMLLEETIHRVWPLVRRHPLMGTVTPVRSDESREPAPLLEKPRFAVIAYGKLGGKELGYASDLDLVFLYDDPNDDARELYARLGRRVSSWVSTLTSSGRLYDVDLRLRPDGDAGLLAVPITAFEQYQTHHAWTWEHQAITRARFVAGDPAIGRRFDAVREQVLLQERDPDKLKADIKAMRQRINAGHPNRTPHFDIKHDRGGMVDVEFVTQYLVLCFSHKHRLLLENRGNIALLLLAADAKLITTPLAARVASAYRTYRKRQHTLRLQGAERARIPRTELIDERSTVMELWNQVLGD